MNDADGKILVEMTMENGAFVVQTKSAGVILRELKSTMDSTATSMNKLEAANSGAATGFRHLVATLGDLRFAALDFYDVFVKLPLTIENMAGQLQKTQTLLMGVSKSFTEAGKAAEAASDFSYILNLAQKAPFAISALSETFVKLKSAGLDPAKGSMQALVDSVARFGGSGEEFKRAGIAIQQMLGKGVISMEELRQQLGEAVPDAMRNMADGMGLTMAELNKKVSQGIVQSQDAINKMFVIAGIRNQGAAAAMMNTWVGALEQLKTRFELAAKDISDSGFGEAMMKLVKDGTAALGSDDFKRLAISLGETMGRAVTEIMSMGKALIDHAAAIKVAAEAWIAYKVSFDLVGPVIRQAIASSASLMTMYTQERNSRMQTAYTNKMSALADAQADLQRLESVRVTEAGIVSARQQSLTVLDAMNARQLASIKAMQIAIAEAEASGGRVSGASFGFGGNFSREDAAAQVSRIESVVAANHAARGPIVADLEAARVAHMAAAGAATTQAAAVERIGGAAIKSSVGMTALGTAAKVAGVAFNAMGGWLGLVNLAIGVGIIAWLNWGQAAQDAADRALRAKKLLATPEDETAIQKGLNDLKKELATRKALYEAAKGDSGFEAVGKTDQRLQLMKQTEAKITDQEALLAQAHKGVLRAEARDLSEVIMANVNDELKTRQTASAAVLAQMNKEMDARTVAAGTDQKKLAAIQLEKSAALKKLALEDAQSRLNVVNDVIKSQQPYMTGGITGSSEAVAQLEAMRKELTDKIAGINQAMGANDFGPGKTAKVKAPIVSKVEDLRRQLTEQAAALAGELPAILDGAADLGKAQAAYDKVIAKFKDGSLNTWNPTTKTTDKATQAQAQELAQMAKNNVLTQLGIDDAKKVVGEMDSLGPEYQEALDKLANPFADAGTPKTDAVNKLLAKIKLDSDAVRLALGDSYDQFMSKVNSMQSRAVTIDASNEYVKIVTSNKSAADELVRDDRERALKQIQTDRDVTEAKIENLITVMKANHAAADDIERMQTALSDFLELNTQRQARAAETPFQKLMYDWQNTTKLMEDATAKWADDSIDMLVNFATTGKLEFGKFVEAILADLLRIQAEKALAPALSGLGGAIGSFFTGGSTAPVAAGTGGAFALGGIMSSQGSLPLKKYAAGGIATSPQMAIFGEGDDNEAYVPLPDGRRIPVSMKGGGGVTAAPVTVNVINQSGTQVSAKSSTPRFDGKKMILDVVLSEMSSPGTFRDAMKTAIR